MEDSKASKIAIEIVKSIKTIIETILEEGVEHKKSFKDLFPGININIYKINKAQRDFSLDLFDSSQLFYEDLLKYLNYHLSIFLEDELDYTIKFKSNFAIINFSVLTDLLLNILEEKSISHSDDIIKFNISILCEIFTKKNERLWNSHSYFGICINELKSNYEIDIPEKNDFIQKMNYYFTKNANNTFLEVKNNLHKYICYGFNNFVRLTKNEDTKKFEEDEIKIDKLAEKINSMNIAYEKIKALEKGNLNELRKICKEKDIHKYFEEYSDCLAEKCKYSGLSEKYNKEYILNNFVLPLELIDININDENNIKIISNLNYNEHLFPNDIFNIGKSFYEQYLTIKKEIDYISFDSYKTEIENIIYKDNDFIKKFYSILKSKTVSFYLKANKKFDTSFDYKINFLENEKDNDEIPDQCLKFQYEQFIKDIENDYSKFRNLIRIKGLCYKIPALTGPSMKIFINPILDFSKEAKSDKNQMKNILESALIIILLYEIANLLKYYPINHISPYKLPITTKNKEAGKFFIYYLFNLSFIPRITFRQSCSVNNLENWKNVENLRKIFFNNINEYKNDKIKKEGELNLYSILEEKEETDRSLNYCLW